MPRPFSELSEEFNATAKAYLTKDDISIDLLTTKYSVLMSHKTHDVEDKRKLVETLYDCGLQWLASYAQPKTTVDHQTTLTMSAHFGRLTDDDSINLIPASAPEQLTDVALDLLRKAENSTAGASTKSYMVKLAGQTLAAADKIKAAHIACTDVSTKQDITASKKITLKQKDEFTL